MFLLQYDPKWKLATLPEAQTSKQHPWLFFKYIKWVMPQDPCPCDFLGLGGFYPKHLYGLHGSFPHFVHVFKVIFSARSSLSLQTKPYQSSHILFLPSLFYIFPRHLKLFKCPIHFAYLVCFLLLEYKFFDCRGFGVFFFVYCCVRCCMPSTRKIHV